MTYNRTIAGQVRAAFKDNSDLTLLDAVMIADELGCTVEDVREIMATPPTRTRKQQPAKSPTGRNPSAGPNLQTIRPKTKEAALVRAAFVGNPEHDFAQSREDWENAVFDNAAYFAVIRYRAPREDPDRYTKHPTAAAAIEYAKLHIAEYGACIYAVTATERSNILDRVKWDAWLQREKDNAKCS